MHHNTLRHRLHTNLYRARFILIAVALLFILYSAVFLWFYVPYGGPHYRWHPDSQLIVQDDTDPPFAAGDIVLRIGEQVPQRMRSIYPQPLQASYDISVLRDGAVHEYETEVLAPFHAGHVRLMLPATAVSLSGWLLGMIMLLLARRQNEQALQIGYTFCYLPLS
jgi:hypothetical protein